MKIETNAGETPNGSTPGQGETLNGNPQDTALKAAQADVTRLQSELGRWQKLGATPESVTQHIQSLNNESAGHRFEAKTAKDALEPLQQRITALEAIGTPDELTRFKERAGVADSRDRDDELGEAASVLKLKNNATFKFLFKDAKFSFEGEGDEKRVKSITEGAKTLSFDDYAKGRAEVSDALPGLQATEAAPTGTPHVRQVHGEQKAVNNHEAALKAASGLYA